MLILPLKFFISVFFSFNLLNGPSLCKLSFEIFVFVFIEIKFTRGKSFFFVCLSNYKRGLPGAARDYFTILLWNSPVQIDLRTLQALGWGWAPTYFFIFKPTPRSNFCLLAPAQFSKHTPPFGRVDPAGPRLGWAPHK